MDVLDGYVVAVPGDGGSPHHASRLETRLRKELIPNIEVEKSANLVLAVAFQSHCL